MLVDKPEFKVRMTSVIIYCLKEGCSSNKAIDLTNDFIEGLSFFLFPTCQMTVSNLRAFKLIKVYLLTFLVITVGFISFHKYFIIRERKTRDHINNKVIRHKFRI